MSNLAWLPPWVVFLLGMAWMTWQGFKAKKEYFAKRESLRRKREEQNRSSGPVATKA